MQDLFAEQLKALRAASLDRHLREISSWQGPEIKVAGGRFVNFSSNDYLGLANDPRLREAVMAAIGEFGVGAGAAVDFLSSPEGEKRRLLLWKRINLLRELLPVNVMNRKRGDAGSVIFPWVVGGEQAALDLASALQTEGFLVPPIRYPTVARGAARLRVTVTASHQENQIRSLCEAIRRLSNIA